MQTSTTATLCLLASVLPTGTIAYSYITTANACFRNIDGAGTRHDITSAEECKDICDRLPGCTGVSYSSGGQWANTCFLAADSDHPVLEKPCKGISPIAAYTKPPAFVTIATACFRKIDGAGTRHNVTSADSCKQICYDTAHCSGVSYSTGGDLANTCFMAASEDHPVLESPCRSSSTFDAYTLANYVATATACFRKMDGAGAHHNVDNAEECKNLCDVLPSCAGVSYSTGGSLANTCFLAAYSDHPVLESPCESSSHFIAYTKPTYVTAAAACFRNIDGAGTRHNVTSAEECKGLCDSLPACSGASYGTGGDWANTCFLAATSDPVLESPCRSTSPVVAYIRLATSALAEVAGSQTCNSAMGDEHCLDPAGR
eukprot:CAMPEP_0117560534 /NCGR_PEP_ID=MMETSP0784-20121206/53925_1 /TAXON_ID=39447 /ORGANISM="" /LENGTH=372 /DNA_ID=CAMNT_0005357945 /DNA_START=106 /DNA_END=1224 /DNA_ORIENTATION=-